VVEGDKIDNMEVKVGVIIRGIGGMFQVSPLKEIEAKRSKISTVVLLVYVLRLELIRFNSL
jgi:hypothetical protein